MMQSNFNTEIDMFTVALPRIVLGMGTAFYFVPLTTILLAGIEPSRNASAMGLVNFLRVLCGAVGTSISITMWDRRADLHHERICETITPYSQSAQIATDNMGGMNTKTFTILDRMIDIQSVTMATTDIFWVSAIVMFFLVGVVWLAKPPFMNIKNPTTDNH
jgi:DHA2 family multidrug resistance protein